MRLISENLLHDAILIIFNTGKTKHLKKTHTHTHTKTKKTNNPPNKQKLLLQRRRWRVKFDSCEFQVLIKYLSGSVGTCSKYHVSISGDVMVNELD